MQNTEFLLLENRSALRGYVTVFCHLLSTSQLHQHTTLHDMLLLLQLCQITKQEEVKNPQRPANSTKCYSKVCSFLHRTSEPDSIEE